MQWNAQVCWTCVGLLCNLYRRARGDLESAMPSRNTVKSTVQQIAKNARDQIIILLAKAIETGGLAATTDTWKDDYRKSTYISIVAHLTIDEDNKCKHQRLVLV